jgi:hypothetical protein
VLYIDQYTNDSRKSCSCKQRFSGVYYRCSKQGYRQADCPDSKDSLIGPLATPSGGRGLLLLVQAQRAPVILANTKGSKQAETA